MGCIAYRIATSTTEYSRSYVVINQCITITIQLVVTVNPHPNVQYSFTYKSLGARNNLMSLSTTVMTPYPLLGF